MHAILTRYGHDAYDALRAAVAEIKQSDLLAPVAVLVPTHLCGVIVRRTLARGVAGMNGVAGLTVLTLDRLAEQIAAPALVGSGRRPAIGPVLAAAWRQALDEDAGVFAPVARHRATVQALLAAHRQLREVDGDGLDALANSGEPITVDLLRLHRRVLAILARHWYDTVDLRRTATDALYRDAGRAAELGTPILFLPQDLPAGTARFVRELDAATPIVTIAALTGDARADAGVRHTLDLFSGPSPSATPAIATRIFHASDADDEVRCIVRQLSEALRDMPAHRIAVLYSAAEPYARLLAEHLGAAGITTNGDAVRPTLSRTLARALLGLLALPDHDWRRDELLALLTSAPVRDADGRRTPAARWDRISRAAGVVSGDDWDTRLRGYAEHERAIARQSENSDTPSPGLMRRCERNAEAADALRSFVSSLRDRLEDGTRCTTWPELAEWAAETFGALVGDFDEEPWLPEDEVRAGEKIERVLAGLAGLGTVETTADLTALRHTLELELADDLPRHGSTGRGVLVGPLPSAIGLDVDLVFVIGLAEDTAPGRISEDALLPDRARALTAGQLPSVRDRVDRAHRHLLASFAAAPHVVASFPRGDLRRSTLRLPSRWLLPSLREHSANELLSASEWDTAAGEWLDGSSSFAASLTQSATLATDQEWRIRAATAGYPAGDDVLRRALDMVRARSSAELTRFEGDLSGFELPHPSAPDRIVSPTALESWSICPHAYFIARLLHVQPVESPETLILISPIEIGNLIHEVLDRFFAHESERGAVPAASQQWTAGQRVTLARIATEVADEFEARGITGHRLLWAQERNRIVNQLQHVLDDDEAVRAATGRQQVRSELVFGMRGAEPVEILLPDGESIRFRGAADRVDRVGPAAEPLMSSAVPDAPAGAVDALVVVDYKSGSERKFTDLGEDDPTAKGTKLQLPVYAHAARAALGDAHTAVTAEYWFVRSGKHVELPLTDHVYRSHTEALAVIASGIKAGLFPHRPPKENGWSGFTECEYCDPDAMGTKALFARWQRKRQDPRLARYVALVEPEEVNA